MLNPRSRIARIGRVVATATVLLLLTAPDAAAQDDNPFGECHFDYKLESLRAMSRDPVTGDWTLSGQIIAICDGTEVYADEVRWNEKTIFAQGNILVVQQGLRITAERMEMDRATRMGTFWKAYGTARLTDEQPNKDLFGTLEPEVMFRADKVERIGQRQYRLTNGWFTTCVQPEPRWVMTGSSGTFTLDDSVTLRNVVFKVKNVPVLYVPYLYYPLEKEDRKTGFLIPTYSNSNIRGPGVSAAFFWAINRSQDATVYWDGYWQYGQGTKVEYRYRASDADFGTLAMSGFWEREMVLDDGTVRSPKRTWTLNGFVNQSLGRHFRLIGNADYFSDAISQQLYQQPSQEFTQSSRTINLAVSGRVPGTRLRLDGLYRQEDVFLNLTTARRLGRTPQIRATYEQTTIRGTPDNLLVSVGGFLEAVNLDVRPDLTNPAFDQQHWRMDGQVHMRAPIRGITFLSVTPSVTWRLTNWTESLDPVTRTPVPIALTRNLFDFRIDMIGPSLERTWRTPENKFAAGFRHLIEPRVSTQWMTAFDSISQVIQIDPAIDGIVGGTLTVNYSLTNQIVAFRRRDESSTYSRPIASVGIGQTYYTNALAALSDTQYLTPTIANFQPVWLRAAVTPVERVTGEFHLYIHPTAKAVQSYTARASFDTEYFRLMAGWSKVQVIPSVPELSDPARASHYVNGLAHVNVLGTRMGISYGFDWDIKNNLLLQQRVIANYIAQCCGFAVDYQVRGLGHLAGTGAPPVDRRWSFSVTLAGIGSFSNPFGSFRQ